MNDVLTFTVADLRAVLEPDLGALDQLKIVPPAALTNTTATWSALNMDGDPVDGAVDVRFEQRADGSFLVTPIVTIAGALGRLMELPWAAGSRPLGTAP